MIKNYKTLTQSTNYQEAQTTYQEQKLLMKSLAEVMTISNLKEYTTEEREVSNGSITEFLCNGKVRSEVSYLVDSGKIAEVMLVTYKE